MPPAHNPVTAFAKHNHKSCRGDVLDNADRMVRDAGLRLTPVRRRVLEILVEGHRAMGAYQVLERLAEDGFAKQPPVAYRALDFLVEHGLVHRIRRLNAFAACMQPGVAHAPAFFICLHCEGVAEAPAFDVSDALKKTGDEMGFRVERMNIEAVGICPNCLQGNGK
ncbi:MAG: Fur family transcriptional regulator [Paracoccaceae bacterium]